MPFSASPSGSAPLHCITGAMLRFAVDTGTLLRLQFRTAHFGMRYCGYGVLGGGIVRRSPSSHITEPRNINDEALLPNPPDRLVPWLLFHTTRITRATARCGTEEPVQH